MYNCRTNPFFNCCNPQQSLWLFNCCNSSSIESIGKRGESDTFQCKQTDPFPEDTFCFTNQWKSIDFPVWFRPQLVSLLIIAHVWLNPFFLLLLPSDFTNRIFCFSNARNEDFGFVRDYVGCGQCCQLQVFFPFRLRISNMQTRLSK